jgi:hypothetical protein
MKTPVLRIPRYALGATILAIGCSLAHAQPSPVHFDVGSSPWYASDAIRVTPEPPVAGQNVEICANLVNPTSTGYSVIVRYYAAGFAIGGAFTPIGDSDIFLPPSSNVRDCIMWVPPHSGPWSFQVRLMTSGYDDEVVERNMDLLEELWPLSPNVLVFRVRTSTPSTATRNLRVGVSRFRRM